MAFQLNGTAYAVTDRILFGTTELTELKRQGTQVWRDLDAPSAIADLAASDLDIDQITITWSAATDNGPSTMAYDIYKDTVLLASGVTSPYVEATTVDSASYYVTASNLASTSNLGGGTIQSNSDTGTTRAPAGSQQFIDNAITEFTVPRGIYSIPYSAYGGGGGGGGGRGGREDGNGGDGADPGFAALLVSGTLTVAPYDVIPLYVSIAVAGGNGASGGDGNYGTAGTTGESTTFGSVVAVGGGGGARGEAEASGCNGNGGPAGEPSDFGVGGDGTVSTLCNTGGDFGGDSPSVAAGGGSGAGGGGGDNIGDSGEAGGGGGAGGRGQLDISW